MPIAKEPLALTGEVTVRVAAVFPPGVSDRAGLFQMPLQLLGRALAKLKLVLPHPELS
jgi:hypothetical protein